MAVPSGFYAEETNNWVTINFLLRARPAWKKNGHSSGLQTTVCKSPGPFGSRALGPRSPSRLWVHQPWPADFCPPTLPHPSHQCSALTRETSRELWALPERPHSKCFTRTVPLNCQRQERDEPCPMERKSRQRGAKYLASGHTDSEPGRKPRVPPRPVCKAMGLPCSVTAMHTCVEKPGYHDHCSSRGSWKGILQSGCASLSCLRVAPLTESLSSGGLGNS